MRKRDLIGPSLLLLFGIIGIVFSISTGSIKVFIIFVVPVFVGQGLSAFISIVLFSTGVIWLLIAYVRSNLNNGIFDVGGGKVKGKAASTKIGGGILFLGPIPIVFWDREILSRFPGWWIILLMAISVFVIFYLAIFLLLSSFSFRIIW